MTNEMLSEALRLARAGWPVFALNGKTPYRNCPSCTGAGCKCNPDVHLLCHAFHAATTNEDKIQQMWRVYPRSNIGLRPAPGYFVIDVDPRHDGVVDPHWPTTRKSWSGRDDGGCHLWYSGRRPKGKLAPGVDIREWAAGYVVAPPSLHPDTGKPYRWDDPDFPIAEWPTRIQGARTSVQHDGAGGPRYAEAPGTWEDVLLPHGWTTNGRGDWLHPQASTVLSAREQGELLYVFSTSTAFEATDAGAPRGYDRVEAYCLLNDLDFNSPEGLFTAIGALS